jgi:plastocyanin
MASGEVEAGLRAYARHERIDLVSGTGPAQDRAIALWTQARARYGNDDVLIVTRRNRDAAVLNTAARAVLRAEGQITGVDITVRSRDRENQPATLDLAVGDKIRFGEGIRQHGIRNGTRASVEAIGPDAHGTLRLTVRLDEGRVVEDAYAAFVRDRIPGRRKAPTLPRISLAYAGTAYSVQGRTASACVYFGATVSDARELYVGLTRHRNDAWLVVERDRLEAAVRNRASDARMVPSTAELHERLFVEARRYSEKVNVVDHVEDRTAFVRTGTIPAPSEDVRLDVQRGFAAGRAFRAVMQEISVAPALMLRQLARLGQQTRKRLPQHIARIIEASQKPLVKQVPDQRRGRGRSGPEIGR